MNPNVKNTLLNYDRMVPRYTSYPTAPHFQTIENDAVYKQALRELPDILNASLYIHIPFCSQLCWYCGCNTKATRKYEPIEDYLDYLIREVHLLAPYVQTGHVLSNIHFGGGSPSMLKALDFENLMRVIKDAFSYRKDIDIAVEIDPREITQERILSYARAGVNRVSLGTQDFNEKTLKAVNREQPFALSRDTISWCRDAGIHQINMDLLYGLPFQTTTTMKETVYQALTLDPDRISLFGYAHVPWMKKHMRMIDEGTLPNKDLRFDLFTVASNMLKANGYVQIGIDHFAKYNDPLVLAQKQGTLRRNFQGYTTDAADVLFGLGASSIGRVGENYVQNHPDMPLYKKAIDEGALPVKKWASMNKDDHIRADIIERIMCYFCVDLNDISKRYDVSLDMFKDDLLALDEYCQTGLVTYENNIITIHEDAYSMARLVASCFDEYYTPAQIVKRHTVAV